VGCLTQVRMKSGLLNACAQATRDGSRIIVLVGEASAVELGRKLLNDVHLKHQAEIQRCQDKVLRLQDKLAECEERARDTRAEFGVEDSLVGRIIGKNGSTLKSAQERFGVRIEVLSRRPPAEPNKRIVRIIGQRAEQVEEARRSIEFVQVSVPLQKDEIGWILGKGFRNIQDVARKADLLYARFNPDKEALELCGLRDSVESAKMLIETHADYLQVYQEMDEEVVGLNQSFDALREQQLNRRMAKGRNGKGLGKGVAGGWLLPATEEDEAADEEVGALEPGPEELEGAAYDEEAEYARLAREEDYLSEEEDEEEEDDGMPPLASACGS